MRNAHIYALAIAGFVALSVLAVSLDSAKSEIRRMKLEAVQREDALKQVVSLNQDLANLNETLRAESQRLRQNSVNGNITDVVWVVKNNYDYMFKRDGMATITTFQPCDMDAQGNIISNSKCHVRGR